MKRIVLELIDTYNNNKVYFTEVPELFKKHFIKKYEKQGFIVKPWDDNIKED